MRPAGDGAQWPQRRHYAKVLVQVVSHVSMPPALTMSSLEGLSTFWKRRLTMLLSTSRSSPKLSRLAGLAIVAAAVVACLLPTFQRQTAQAQVQTVHSEAKLKGRLYATAALRLESEDKKIVKYQNMIIAIDPATGKWQEIVEDGDGVRLSPDGRTLVFNRTEPPGTRARAAKRPPRNYSFSAGIWISDARGKNNQGEKIYDKRGVPIWSPDGKYLVGTEQEPLFDNDNDEDKDKARTTPAWKDETWRIDADGKNPTRLTIPDTDAVEDWSPDGQWFVTCSDRHPPYGRGYQLYLMKTDGAQERRLTRGGLNCGARFSPDGKKIVFIHQTAKAGNSLWTMDVDGKNAREILAEINLAFPHGACWSPDGKQLAVVMLNWEQVVNGRRVGIANPRIEVMNADGSDRRQLKLQGPSFTYIGSLGDWR
jgi:hypothetical protein